MWAFERAGGRYHVVGRLVAKEHDENQLLRISVPSGDHPRNGGWNTQNVHKILNYKAFMPRIRECGAVAPISTISTSYASAAVSRIIHQAIWLYLRFTLSFRDVEDLLA